MVSEAFRNSADGQQVETPQIELFGGLNDAMDSMISNLAEAICDQAPRVLDVLENDELPQLEKRAMIKDILEGVSESEMQNLLSATQEDIRAEREFSADFCAEEGIAPAR